MALFQVVTLACWYAMNTECAVKFCNFMKEWTDDLYALHPHTEKHEKRTNIHISFHLYDFFLLFGPVISWWCFHFECLIGALQKINMNDKVGGIISFVAYLISIILNAFIGTLEATLLKSHMRGANLWQWLNRPDCPEIIQQFKNLFDKAFSSHIPQIQEMSTSGRTDVAYYAHNGVMFSCCSTHLGNSLVLYYPPHSSLPLLWVASRELTLLVSRYTFLSSIKSVSHKEHMILFADIPHSLPLFTLLKWMTPRTRLHPSLSFLMLPILLSHAVILNLSRE